MLSARGALLLRKSVSVGTWALPAHRLRRPHEDSSLQRRLQGGELQLGTCFGVASSQGSCRLLAAVSRVRRAGSGTVATMDSPPLGYRANVGICLVNNRNEVFVAARVDVPEAWQMPQGGIDEGEEPRDAAIRELREETGVTSAKLIGEVPEWLTYDFPPEVRANLVQLWGQDWTGQAQKWDGAYNFVLVRGLPSTGPKRFYGDESEINLTGDGVEAPEFSDWKWIPVDDVVARAVLFKKQVYARAFEVLTPIIVATSPIT